MNYEKLYYAIINKALRKQITGQRFKGDGTYYENHHIKPRSLNGSDDDKNLVLLTPKEHYLCHWLLVKRYDIDSVERRKMLKAWFMMAAIGDNKRPKINMRDYEKYKIEYSSVMSEAQSGKRNSIYNKHWYTSIDTGESKFFFEKPNDRWIEGKNWFNNKLLYDIKSHNKICIKNGRLCKPLYILKEEKFKELKIKAQLKWDNYHSGNYKSIIDFCRSGKCDISYVALSCTFKKYIPLYNKILCGKRQPFSSNKELIGKYE